MRRREFITLLGGAATWPLAARAQQPTKLPTIGFLGTTTLSAMGEWVAAFVQRLRELGWIEGRNIAIEYRWAEARSERYGEIAAELVQSKVDVIVTTAPAFPAVQRATSVIPIVFALSADPVAAGFIASLARPGGNATGLSMLSPDTAGKRLELLREIVPGIRRLAVMVNLGFPDAVQEGSEAHAAASALGLEVVKLEIRRPQDIASSFESLKADALYVTGDALFNANRIRINTFSPPEWRAFLAVAGKRSCRSVVCSILSRICRVPRFRRANMPCAPRGAYLQLCRSLVIAPCGPRRAGTGACGPDSQARAESISPVRDGSG
jgi:putative ABC transport system substrate-binding protein